MRWNSSGLYGGLVLLACSSLASADTQRVDAKPGLVELAAGPFGDAVDVSWEARQPYTLEFKTYQLADGRSVAVFYGLPGEYVVISDVIDWDARKRTKTTFIVNVEGDTPTPPNPGPEPEPDNPRPLGFAGDVYDAVKLINKPGEAEQIVQAFRVVHSELAARADMTPAETQQRLNMQLRAIEADPKWQGFAKVVTDYLNTHGKSRSKVLDIYSQVIEGMESAI